MQPKSSGKATSPPTARVWVNATWSPDAPAKKRTLSLSAAERGMLSDTTKNTAVPRVTGCVTTSNGLPCLDGTCTFVPFTSTVEVC